VSQPDPPVPEQPKPAAEPDPATEPDEEPAPLNRAERRAKAKKGEPTHVGPRGDLVRQIRGGRPHSKRPR
jgi:hypothetical protein